jgi:hypothetical protein
VRWGEVRIALSSYQRIRSRDSAGWVVDARASLELTEIVDTSPGLLLTNSNGVADEVVWAYNELAPIRETVAGVAQQFPLGVVELGSSHLQHQVNRALRM